MAFSAAFRVLAAADVQVFLITIATGAVTQLTLTTHYTVSGVGLANTVITTVATYSNAYQLRIKRRTTRLQEVDYRDNDPFPAETHERALDRAMMIAQELDEAVSRSIRAPDGETLDSLPTATDRAGKVPSFDSLGRLVVTAPASGSAAELASTLAGITSAAEGAGTIGYNQSKAYAAGTVGAKLKEIVSVKDFGALGDGATDDSAAFTAWAAALVAQGGGVAVIPPGTYNVACPTGSALCAFTSAINGLVILAGGAVINDTQSGYGTTLNSTLFRFTGSKNVSVPEGMRVETARTLIAYSTTQGLSAFELLQGCQGFDIALEMDGGLAAVKVAKAYSDPASYSSRDINARIVATRTHYPYVGQFAGDSANVRLNATECGRNFFIYGVKHVKVDVRSVDQKVTSLIKAYNGYGCEDVDVDYYDRDSTTCNSAAPVMAVEFGDSTAARHADIDIHLNVKNPGGANPWGSVVSMGKFSDGGSTVDVTGRGHVLDGFKLSGVSDQNGIAQPHITQQASTLFASTDVIRGFSIEDFIGRGAGANIQPNIPVLDTPAVIRNVSCQGNINTSNGTSTKVIFIGVEAANLTTATNVTDAHDYIDCDITVGDLQNVDDNKTFINTKVAGVTKNATLRPPRTKEVLRATKTLSGDLTGTNNIFLIAPALGTGGMFRLKYHLVADNSDLTAATRDETFGIKSFSATMNGSGVWEAQIAVGNEVTERTQGTASVMTVSLVNGSAAGGHIAVACTNYNGANARGYFEIEMISMTGTLATEISAT